jgi:branched-chain amino acid transport system permease protein
LDRFIFLTTDGLSKGAVYAAFALSLVLIWRAARIVNFSQGAIAIASAYVAFSVTTHTNGNYWLGFGAAIVSGLVLGILVERTTMRFVGHERPLDSVIVALGVVLVIQAVLGFLYGNEFLPAAGPPGISQTDFQIGGVTTLSPYDLYVFAAVALLVAFLGFLFSKTKVGLRLRASAFAPEVSRLLGVNVTRMVTFGWALAAAAGALAAMLILPGDLGLHPNAMDGVFVTAFTGAVIGGLDSPQGAVVGGLTIGLLLNYVTGYLNPFFGADLASVAVLALLLGVLLVRPGGLFSGVAARQV